MARTTTTCGRCGGTARSESSTGFVRWAHVTPPAVPHPVDPDDGYVSGPADDEAGDPL